MSRIIIEYCPNLSEKANKLIKNNIVPSMESLDGSTNQYEISIIREELNEYSLHEDVKLVDKLIDEDVAFIEL